jgi:DNA topoisomerase I
LLCFGPGSMKLFLVESPAKIKTIKKFLGKEFILRASLGHVREIPKKGLGIDISSGFRATFQIIPSKSNNTREILDLMKKAEMVYFAQDLDREGELIAWHLLDESMIEKEKVRRVVFHEITKKAVLGALEHPRAIDSNLVGAGMGRTVLDRLIGYKLSPMVWKRFESDVPLSVGRVQTVALRVLVERDREIEAFQKEEYWNLKAKLEKGVEAEIELPTGKRLSREEMEEFQQKLINPCAIVKSVEAKTEKRNPKPPFITATLQQEASTRLSLSAKDCMKLAQELYEGVSIKGDHKALITYMRTDAVNLAPEAVEKIREFITEKFGKNYVPGKPVEYKKKSRNAQEAHEAIRPVDFSLPPEQVKPFLKEKQHLLYKMIWDKTVASQMKPALFDATRVRIDINSVMFRAKGTVLRFDGFLKVYDDRNEETPKGERDREDKVLPPLREGESLQVEKILSEKKFTKPPPRYTEASLVKFLEKRGIGRPSTYAMIVETLIARNYAFLEKRKFQSTELGRSLFDWVKGNFDQVVDYEFTARMEDSLDEIAQGRLPWVESVDRYYKPLKQNILKVQGFVEEDLSEEEKHCPKCSKPLQVRSGKFGPFLGCSAYPDCDYIRKSQRRKNPVTTGICCKDCGGEYVLRKSDYGKYFACSNYPECKSTRNHLTKEEYSIFREHLRKIKGESVESMGK